MQNKFKVGDFVELDINARGWDAHLMDMQFIVNDTPIDPHEPHSDTVLECVTNYPWDFQHVEKSGALKLYIKENLEQPKTKPHKHAELIKKWADGAKIELLTLDGKTWIDDPHPDWHSHNQYRETKEREFPKTSLKFGDLYKEHSLGTTGADQLMRVANLAIKQYILDMEKDNVG